MISSDLFLNHEMCITAFSSIKDDVDKQCAIVRRMKEIGICAVVLYYIQSFAFPLSACKRCLLNQEVRLVK